MAHKPSKRDKKTGKLPPMASSDALPAGWLGDEEAKLKKNK
jgi:hypothetical protein